MWVSVVENRVEEILSPAARMLPPGIPTTTSRDGVPVEGASECSSKGPG